MKRLINFHNINLNSFIINVSFCFNFCLHYTIYIFLQLLTLNSVLVIARCLKITEKVSFIFWVHKSLSKMTKNSFWKLETCGQTVLQSVLIRKKLVKTAKFKNSNATFGVIFTVWIVGLLLNLLLWKKALIKCQDVL